MRQYRAREAKTNALSRLEHAEKGEREALQERDDVRKRTRQARLRELRAGQTAASAPIALRPAA